MSNVDGITALAAMFKGNENITPPSITTGTVITPPPHTQIRLNDVIILDNSNLIFGASLLGGYNRNLKFTATNCGHTDLVNDGGNGVSAHSHDIERLDIDVDAEHGQTLVKGDEVILVPTVGGQLYYVLDKAVRL